MDTISIDTLNSKTSDAISTSTHTTRRWNLLKYIYNALNCCKSHNNDQNIHYVIEKF